MRRQIGVVGVVAVAMGLLSVAPANTAEPGPCTEMTRECMIEVARTYIDVQTGTAPSSQMRVAPHVQRWENGVNTGDGARSLRGSDDDDAEARIVPGAVFTGRDLDRVWVDVPSGETFFRWMMDVSVNGQYTSTAHIFERIRIEDGVCGDEPSPCITEIEAVFCIGQQPKEQAKPSPRPYPNIVVHFLCHRSG